MDAVKQLALPADAPERRASPDGYDNNRRVQAKSPLIPCLPKTVENCRRGFQKVDVSGFIVIQKLPYAS
jgi:hypothetical protein